VRRVLELIAVFLLAAAIVALAIHVWGGPDGARPLDR
jgi:hypothetical protein